jgi:hypothetical protein
MIKRSDPWHTRSSISRWAHVKERTGLALARGRMRIVRHHTRGKGWHRPDRFGCCRPGRCFTGLPVSISDRSASCSTTECTCRSGMDPVPVGMPWNCSARPEPAFEESPPAVAAARQGRRLQRRSCELVDVPQRALSFGGTKAGSCPGNTGICG